VTMKIALVILHAQTARGGAERYTLDLAIALAKRGHEISLLANSFDEGIDGVKKVLLPAQAATRSGRYGRFLQSLDDHLSNERYDIVHAMLPVRRCDLYHPHAGIAAEAVTTGHLKYSNVATRSISRLSNRFNARRQRFAAVERELLGGPHPPGVLCLSEYVKRITRQYHAIPDQHLLKLFNAVDLTKFDPAREPTAGPQVRHKLGIPQSRVVALMIAQDFERKGLRPALEALAHLKDPNLTLLVVGKQDPAPYRRLAGELGIDAQVIFAGSTDNPYAFYSASDFFVLPTRHDPCSLVVLEALAMGLPVISTVFNGACEIMSDCVQGFVLPSATDVPALASAMQKLTDSSFRHDATRACMELRSKLSMEAHLDRLETIYRARSGKSADTLIEPFKPLQ
jgi:UDP-glucose:(heptosyl)LPS alpha-1,3-glucosyltransferase